MKPIIPGIHHITVISGNAKENYDFYTKVLGLRMVKKTVNFDDNGTYHLYYGNETGNPGTILTFFPWEHARPQQKGSGLSESFGYIIPTTSLEFWKNRLQEHGVAVTVKTIFGDQVLEFDDPHGVGLYLVASDTEVRQSVWNHPEVPSEHALSTFHGVLMNERNPEATEALLINSMGYEKIATEGKRTRYKTGVGELARYLDILHTNDADGAYGKGAIHHIAFRTASDDEQHEWLETLWKDGYQASNVRDRSYFRSIYFREPGGILFEIATDEPGFATDESVQNLGTGLKLPPWIEPKRSQIEAVLQPLD